MIYKHEDGTINTFYQKGETVEYPSDKEVIKYIDNAESWDAVDEEVYEELCKRLGIDISKFDDPDDLFIEIQTQFIYNKCNLERWRRGEIREDFENGLTFEQVQLYAKPEFKYWQMEEIRVGFQNGLTFEQVELYAKPEFECLQMDRIRRELEDGLTFEKVMAQISEQSNG